MKRRDFLSAAGAAAVLTGCTTHPASIAGDTPAQPGAGARVATAAPDLSKIDVYIPGYNPAQAMHRGAPVLDNAHMRRAIPKDYDRNITMLTKFGFDGSVRQALFPVRGHDIAISPNKKLGFFGSMEGNDYVAFDPHTLDRIALGRPYATDWIGGGHGAFLSNRVLAVTERAPKIPYTGRISDHFGHVTLRDPHSLKIIGDFSTHGISPHEIRILDDGKHAAIANYGSTIAPGATQYGVPRHIVEASITVVEISSGKLVEKYFGNSREELRHLCARDRDMIFAIQAELVKESTNASGVASRKPLAEGAPAETARSGFAVAPTVRVNHRSGRLMKVGRVADRALMREGLSIEHDTTHDEVIATYPATHTVMVFDAPTGALKHRIDCEPIGLQTPCGVALLPGQDFYVVTGYMRNLYVFERGTHKLHRELSHYPLNFGHSHIVAA